MRIFSSAWDETRIPRRRVLAILPKKDSIQEPWVGVKMNSKRLGTVARKVRVSREICAE